jgi:hypothetical protein
MIIVKALSGFLMPGKPSKLRDGKSRLERAD